MHSVDLSSSLLRAGARRADRDGVLADGGEVVLDGFAGGVEIPSGDEVDVVTGEILDEELGVVGVDHLEDGGHLEGRVQHALARLSLKWALLTTVSISAETILTLKTCESIHFGFFRRGFVEKESIHDT